MRKMELITGCLRILQSLNPSPEIDFKSCFNHEKLQSVYCISWISYKIKSTLDTKEIGKPITIVFFIYLSFTIDILKENVY